MKDAGEENAAPGLHGEGRAEGLAPVVRHSTVELIAERLREAIATGWFSPGQQLLETALATELGVSRGPLREAIQRLTQEGLLVGHRNRGVFVLELDEAELRDLYLFREAVESAAVRHLVRSGRHGEAGELLSIVAQMREEDEPGSTRMSLLDMEFHRRLVELAGSPRLTRVHDSLLVQLRLCLARMAPTYASVRARADEHEGVVRALLRGDAPLTDELIRLHMKDGLDRLLPLLSESEPT